MTMDWSSTNTLGPHKDAIANICGSSAETAAG